MLKESPREEKLGCLFGLVGGLAGFLLAGRSVAAEAERRLAADPSALDCGLPAAAAMFWGIVLGALAGTLFGMILSRLLPPAK